MRWTQSAWQLGPLQISGEWLAIIVSLVIGGGIIGLLRLSKEEREALTDAWFNGLIWFLISFKLLPVFLSPFTYLENPLMILYARATPNMMILVYLLAIIGWFWTIIKQRLPFERSLYDTLFAAVITYTIYSILVPDYGKTTDWFTGIKAVDESEITYHPVNWYKAFLLIILITYEWMKKRVDDKGVLFLVNGMGAVLFITDIFTLSAPVYGLTILQWAVIAVLVLFHLFYQRVTRFLHTFGI
ncbi:hypothetical protein L1765_00795 [Microaerobacter geothermalis]|uniref:hypothetical protein n=1 Tax=Microaerobacter geothermalis TaxID=674972 RepID=UPI001F249DB6|nr:hypothetical protein [Microaerobacter geothermalis]MCF6092529.1 hypothetical protein [Microaerobacter geothermalis]